ncbi:YHS domain-containing protein [Cribrihabitans marinus]|uniref:YHS domain-containing protein n=1 Tax=Cribrihabitans marinus TaxID=1227549 RepID=A0A1H6ZIU4_9RHOB|nr:YHS domain-containing (seleno)protein [Cribrihabitans marinus]GGH30676.1 hypothetical protein GCM10010973_20990 [Cribrihabitans marinus]SEJ52626.1 YHS domain-containing protein [Cribrihabitans marinus]
MQRRRSFLAGLAAIALAPAVWAETPVYYAPAGVAIGGYDPVAYFRDNAPTLGRAEISVRWKGAEWHFDSQANRAAFEANPRAYAPQFGGYCAYAMSLGRKSTTDPEAWRIVDGKLYLVHSRSVARVWEADMSGNIIRAEAHWPAVLYD